MNCIRVGTSVTDDLAATLLITLVVGFTVAGYRQRASQIEEEGGFAMRDASDCLAATSSR